MTHSPASTNRSSYNNTVRQQVSYAMPCLTPSMHTLEGRFIHLKKLDFSKHVEPLFEALCLNSDDSIWEYLPYGPFDNLAAFSQWLTKTCAYISFYVLCDPVTDELYGMAGYLDNDTHNRSIEIGCVIFADVIHRTSKTTEALYLMIKEAFASGYRRCVWRCDSLNHRSHACALRLGFTFEGIWRQAMIVKGFNRDTAWHSILDHEWPNIEKAFTQWLAPDNFDAAQQQIHSLSYFKK